MSQIHECSDDCIVNLRDLWESMDMILTAYHPKIRDEVMGMWGNAIGDNADRHLVFSCASK
jgi:hypothetical protein